MTKLFDNLRRGWKINPAESYQQRFFDNNSHFHKHWSFVRKDNNQEIFDFTQEYMEELKNPHNLTKVKLIPQVFPRFMSDFSIRRILKKDIKFNPTSQIYTRTTPIPFAISFNEKDSFETQMENFTAEDLATLVTYFTDEDDRTSFGEIAQLTEAYELIDYYEGELI